MKKKKKIYVILMLVCMMLTGGLAACSQSQETEKSSQQEQETVSEAGGDETVSEDSRDETVSAENIPVSGDTAETMVIEDVMLTFAPSITLTDTLSSTMNGVELQAGNCSWNYEESCVMQGIEACGAHPLDETFAEYLQTWDLPAYQRMDGVMVSLTCQVLPDKLLIREWNANDLGDTGAEEISVITLDHAVDMFELKPDRVYEITAFWNEESGRGYFGSGSYVLLTE